MAELWYYAEGVETRGPLSTGELIPMLGRIADPRRVMIWRQGFEDWKPVEDVLEIAQQVIRSAPVRGEPPSLSPVTGEPAVDAPDTKAVKNLKPKLTGLGGWLAIVVIGQIVGILRLLSAMAQYFATLDHQVLAEFPAIIWGEAALNAAVLCLAIYTTILLLRRSRPFPRFFTLQMIAIILMPFLDHLWAASMIWLWTGDPVSQLLTLDESETRQLIQAVVGAMVWIPYIRRSRRVRNTFTR